MRPPVSINRSAGAWLALAGLFSPLPAADPIQEIGRIASEWVQIRSETVRLEQSWAQDRALISAALEGLKERATRLEEKRDHLLAATAEQRAETATLAAKLAEAKESQQAIESRLQPLAARVLQLRPQLPPRLSAALEMSYRSLAGTAGSPAERLQLVFTVLNRCAQFNLSIEHGEEVLTLPGESAPKAVDVMYWGLSHGYALDRAGGKAWLGAPGRDGWRWEALEGAVPAVSALFAIRRDEADPRLVDVPARLKAASAP